MLNKSQRIAATLPDGPDPYYLGYFERFNRGEFYEAHDVLEQLWLAEKKGHNYAFYKGLIQLAGAFVHLQKNRLRPSAALFKLAHANLKSYPPNHRHLDVPHVLALIEHWLKKIEAGDFLQNHLT